VVDPARYRSREETDRVRALDPVAAFRVHLIDGGVLAEADAVRIDAQVEEEVTAAVEFADASPSPEPDQLFAHAYATMVPNAPNQIPGEPVVTIP